MRIKRWCRVAVLSVVCAGAIEFRPIEAQTPPTVDPVFGPYTGCHLSDGLAVVETAPLAVGVTSRTVKTITGSYTVTMTDGRRVMFAYPDEDFFANVKVETLPAEGYAESKKALIGDFEKTLASGDNSRTTS